MVVSHEVEPNVPALQLTLFLTHLSSEFIKRWNEEEQETCKTPVVRKNILSCTSHYRTKPHTYLSHSFRHIALHQLSEKRS
jgi:hypothetical protein